MPMINIRMVEGTYDRSEKDRIIQGVTDTVVAVKGEGVRPFVTVLIEDVGSGEWGAGGQSVTTDLVLKLIAEGNARAHVGEADSPAAGGRV